MVGNHLDARGNYYLSFKINKVKDTFLGKMKNGESPF